MHDARYKIHQNDIFQLFRNTNLEHSKKNYKQIDGVAMGSPLGPTLANTFLYFHEQIWLNECPDEFKPVYYRKCVDDIFILFRSPVCLEKSRIV